jgi:heat shock protein HslJ
MKKSITLFVASVVLLFGASSCSVFKGKDTQQVSINQNIYGTKWKLIELNGETIADKINGKEPFLSFDKETSRYSASGGCNGLGGTFEVKGKEIKFSPGMSTMMACMDMSVEDGFRTIFGKTVKFDLEEGEISQVLTLKNGKNTIAKFRALTDDNTAQLNGTWELDYISGPRIAFEGLYPNKKPTIQFDLENSRISGNGSCNNYNGSVKIDGQQISFGAIASTKMMCQDIKGEDLYFQTLEKVNTFSVIDGQLNFIMGDIAIMRFKKL